jgi:hypothetical protein
MENDDVYIATTAENIAEWLEYDDEVMEDDFNF